jgi:dihydroorotate dehydrogenase electron transfer subunit
MTKRVEDFQIIDNKKISKEYFILELKSKEQLPELKPGQFVQIKVVESPETFLRRPISVHDVDFDQNILKLLIKISGLGTETLSKKSRGEFLNLLYPLGNHFSLPQHDDKILLIGGGCGVAPLLFLGKYLRANSLIPDFILGYKSKDSIIEYEEFKKLGEIFVTTEDGSEGTRGFVTDHTVFKDFKYSRVYCCGPESMMKAVASICRSHKVSCEISLENLMACGFGVCLCCVVDTTRGNVCTCTEGPVFNINDLKW